jgi:integrase
MGNLELIELNKTYDSRLDLWIDEIGGMFVKNQHDPKSPVYINISSQKWIFKNLGIGQESIDWDELDLPKDIDSAFKIAVRAKLKRASYRYPKHCRLMLLEFKAFLKPGCVSLSELKMSDMNLIWQKMKPANRPYLRTLYSILAKHNVHGACHMIAAKLKRMNAREKEHPLKHVFNWHPTKGALTQEEENVLRDAIETQCSNDIRYCGARIFCWLLFSTLKRGKQIRELQPNCTKFIENNGVKEYFVLVKPVKHQTGDPKRWWPIPEALYLEMQRYSTIPLVLALQQIHDKFLVLECSSMRQDGVISAASARQLLTEYVKKKLNLISPRTRQLLHITPCRIRHTGATRLAYKGVPRDIIAEILEHDDPNSCQAYIDALGSELCPNLDKADNNMGSHFMQLNHIYFNGRVIDNLSDQSIVIPDFQQSTSSPLFVGSCSRDTCKEGPCHKHPFIGCYNGCSSFLAWCVF